MTLGDGIVTATILVLLAAGLYLIGRHRKWALAGKIAGSFIALVTVIGLGGWGFDKYKNRPHQVTSFAGVELGMTPAEVKVILGAPNSEKPDSDKGEFVLTFNDSYTARNHLFLVFKGEDTDHNLMEIVRTGRAAGSALSDEERAILAEKEKQLSGSVKLDLICDSSSPRLFGITSSSSMDDVLRRLGSPTSERINDDELSKLLIYDTWNARFLIERNKVQGICVGRS